MYVIRADSIAEAHYDAIKLIMSVKTDTITQDEEVVRQLPEPLSVHITHPEKYPQVIPGSLFQDRFQQEYTRKVLSITPMKRDGTDPAYTYGNRLRAYPQSSFWYKLRNWLGFTEGLDQIERIKKLLEEAPETRRAVAITWDPEIDLYSYEVPCLDLVQLTVNDGKLNLVAYFRSNDILSAWGMNVLALYHLQNDLAVRLGLETGYLETISHNPHIYYIRDAYELKLIREAHETK